MDIVDIDRYRYIAQLYSLLMWELIFCLIHYVQTPENTIHLPQLTHTIHMHTMYHTHVHYIPYTCTLCTLALNGCATTVGWLFIMTTCRVTKKGELAKKIQPQLSRYLQPCLHVVFHITILGIFRTPSAMPLKQPIRYFCIGRCSCSPCSQAVKAK